MGSRPQVAVHRALICRTRRLQGARIEQDASLVATLWPGSDLERDQASLDLFPLPCSRGAGGGPIGNLSEAEHFHRLVAPHSTAIQTGPVHCGRCTDPQAALDGLFERAVLPQPSGRFRFLAADRGGGGPSD